MILINPTTAAVTSVAFTANANNTGLLCDGLVGAETVKLQVYNSITKAYVDVKIKGAPFVADASNNLINIFSDAFIYRVVKSATASAVGVSLEQNNYKV